jgi:paraquat-inducible protein B
MSRKASPTLIGSFVLGGVVLSVLAVVVLGSESMFRDTESFISFFGGSVAGLDAGAPVRFRGIEVGEVKEVLLDLPGVERLSADVRIAVVYELDRELLESRGATARLTDPLDAELLLALGIRAELATESLVTGRKYIALDLQPTIPVESEPVVGAPYPEIPTLDTGLERIEDELYGIIAELGAVQLDSLVSVATAALTEFGALASKPELEAALDELPGTIRGLNASLDEARTLVADLDASLEPVRDELVQTSAQATSTMLRFESTLDALDGVLEPRSPVFVRFEKAMMDLSAASYALRNLADYLERNPSALVRGRPGGD